MQSVQITVRLPVDLNAQVTDRARVNRRSRNAEIVTLVEDAIDNQVRRDMEAINSKAPSS